MPRTKSLCPNGARYLISVFDLRHPGAEERLNRERDAWRGFAHVEKLTAETSVLVVLPGAAAKLAA